MKVVLLAGGQGTRMGETGALEPKPLLSIAGRPILWHIMKLFGAAGFDDFVVCLGYRGFMIKKFFEELELESSDIEFDFRAGFARRRALDAVPDQWKVLLADTGLDTQTGGRLKRIARYLDDQRFMMTYGDGVSDVNLDALLSYHVAHGKLCTVTAVRPPARFGALTLGEGGSVVEFREKPVASEGWINGGFFVLEREALEYVEGDETAFEHEPLSALARDGQLAAFTHEGFWQPMDTRRDRETLEELWRSGRAPWKVWL